MQRRFVAIKCLEEINEARFKMAVRATRAAWLWRDIKKCKHENSNNVKTRAVIGRAHSYHETQMPENAINGNSCHICSAFALTELIREMYFCLLLYVLTGYF